MYPMMSAMATCPAAAAAHVAPAVRVPALARVPCKVVGVDTRYAEREREKERERDEEKERERERERMRAREREAERERDKAAGKLARYAVHPHWHGRQGENERGKEGGG